MAVLSGAIAVGRSDIALVAGAGSIAWLGNWWANHLSAMIRAALLDQGLFERLWLADAVRVRTDDGCAYSRRSWRDAAGGLHVHG
jgi:hypothetical protein